MYLAQMVHPTIFITGCHQGNVPDGLEVCPLPAVARHTEQVLGAVLVLKAPLQLGVPETDTHTEVNIAEVTNLNPTSVCPSLT